MPVDTLIRLVGAEIDRPKLAPTLAPREIG
jgi:hypothetical protein